MDYLFKLNRTDKRGLQNQLCDQICTAIVEGNIAPGAPMPSSRRLADQLGIARNTVMLAYATLQDDGFLVSRERSGYFVNDHIESDVVKPDVKQPPKDKMLKSTVDWDSRLTLHASRQRHIVKPANWRDFKYCFVYGQLDPTVFPVKHWRECWRDAVGVQEISEWSQDLIDRDDAILVEQIRKRLLTRRGLWVDESQIMVTVGAQNALYTALRLLLNQGRCFGLEDPGYPDARNIASIFTDTIKPLPIDHEGLIPGKALSDCDVVFLTPSHQSPTTVTMPVERRRALIEQAERDDFLMIEDDYEAETNFTAKPVPALMSFDDKGRVIYIGSLSKTLAPGLRLGYMVGPPAFIRESRALRRLIMRHPAANNQRAAAYFLARGHHEALMRSLVSARKKKRAVLMEALAEHLPDWSVAPSLGGSSVWITGPDDLDARELARACMAEGVLIEPGDVHFFADKPPVNSFRLGYTSIVVESIGEGIAVLAGVAGGMG